MRYVFCLWVVLLAGCNARVAPQTGFCVKDGQAAYVTHTDRTLLGQPTGHEIVRPVQADAETFEIIPRQANAPKDSLPYARDSDNVFVGILTYPLHLANCDPQTFTYVSADGKYVKDIAHVYYCGIQLEDADPQTFQRLDPPYAKDAGHVYAGAVRMEKVDAASFRVVMPGMAELPWIKAYQGIERRESTKTGVSMSGWGRDKGAYYFADRMVEVADYDSFQLLSMSLAKDDRQVYYASKRKVRVIPDADAASFRLVGSSGSRGRDKQREYVNGARVDELK